MEYWPLALYCKEDGTVGYLETSTGFPSYEKALDAIREWADRGGYHLICASINACVIGISDLLIVRYRVF